MSSSRPDRRHVSAADHDFRTEAFSLEDLAQIRRADAQGRGAGPHERRESALSADAVEPRPSDRADVVATAPVPGPRATEPAGSAAPQARRPADERRRAGGATSETGPAREAGPEPSAESGPAGRLPRTGPRLAQVLLAVLAPLVLLVGIVRLVASPVFLWAEYHRPGFPADPYGFTTGDRMHYGSAGLDYLFNLAPSRYLGDLFWQGMPVFSDAEVSHMDDVKAVMLATMAAGAVLALVCLALLAYLARTSPGGIRRGLFAGALWFLLALTVLAVTGAFAWEALFAGFHSVFFADGTWTFAASDGLIRLYPGQFWIDAALAIAGLSLAAALLTLLLCWPTRRRRERDRARREDLARARGRRSLARQH